MSTHLDGLDAHEHEWLHTELDALLVGEPPMSGAAVVDDVRRGEAVRVAVRRRRTATYAIAAVLAVVAVPVGLLLRAAPDAASPPAAPRSPTASAFTAPDIAPALTGTGWSVVDGRVTVSPPSAIGYLLAPSNFSVSTSANLFLYVSRSVAVGPYLAECTPTICTAERIQAIADGVTSTSGYREDGTHVASTSGVLSAGSLILDRSYGTGTLVEVVVTPAWTTTTQGRSSSSVAGKPVLTLEQTRAVLDLVGDPYGGSSVTPQPSVSASSSLAGGVRYVSDGDWPGAVLAALPATGTLLAGPGDAPDGSGKQVSLRLVRDGVGTSLTVGLDRPTPGSVSPLAGDPCTSTGPSCTVLMPWKKSTVGGVSAFVAAWEVSGPTSAAGSPYSGPYTLRNLLVLRGQTTLTITSDSRDVDASGYYQSSSAPGLSLPQLEAFAAAAPLPSSYESYVWTPLQSASPGPTGAPSSTPQSAAQIAQAQAHPCATADLTVTQPWQDGATGTMLYGLLFHNRSAQACGLVGFPAVALAGSHGALPLVSHTTTGGGGGPLPERGAAAVLLAPGADAHGLVTKYRCDNSQVGTASTLRVTVNGGTPVSLPITQALCSGGSTDPGNQLDIWGYYPGTS